MSNWLVNYAPNDYFGEWFWADGATDEITLPSSACYAIAHPILVGDVLIEGGIGRKRIGIKKEVRLLPASARAVAQPIALNARHNIDVPLCSSVAYTALQPIELQILMGEFVFLDDEDEDILHAALSLLSVYDPDEN